MSAARDLFLNIGWLVRANEGAHDKLLKVAELWRADGQHFSAGIAMLRAVDAAWGHPDRMLEAQRAALHDLERVVSQQAGDNPASIAALHKIIQTVSRSWWLFEVDRSTIRTRIRELISDFAQRLLRHFRHSDHADNYLVRGFNICTDLDGTWTIHFPLYEVPLNSEQSGAELVLNIPSAFHLFVFDGDWQGAHEIIEMRSDAFTSTGLNGWRAVTLANLNPGDAVVRFDEAADAFAADAQPRDEELSQRGGQWSGINQQLWAKYFRARARLVESIQAPQKVTECLAEAAKALEGTEAGWHSGEVSRFHVLVKVLANLVSDPLSFSDEEARREYQLEITMSQETEEDRLALTFIHDAASAFRGFASDPASEMTRSHLGSALETLAKIPNIGPDVTDAVRPTIGKNAMRVTLGPVLTWMHRGLEAITNEGNFRLVLLRLLQGGLPLYAQLRHGPIEYGKDIVVLFKKEDLIVLRQYQVKVGDINTRKWRESRDELEEIFLVPLSDFQLPVTPQRIQAVLVTNGHANQFVEPVMEGWFKEQREQRGRQVEFMHLDGLVDWIVEHRMVNELRVALREQGVDSGAP
jgi:hypothetical protein